MSETRVVDNPEANQYELHLDDEVIGLASYKREVDVMVFPHFEVNPEHQGGGMASSIARFALDDCRERGLKVRAVCPYLVTFLKRHPEYQDLTA